MSSQALSSPAYSLERHCTYEIYAKSDTMRLGSKLIGQITAKGLSFYSNAYDGAKRAKQIASDAALACLTDSIRSNRLPETCSREYRIPVRQRYWQTGHGSHITSFTIQGGRNLKSAALKAMCNDVAGNSVKGVKIWTKRVQGGGTCNFGAPGSRTDKYHTLTTNLARQCRGGNTGNAPLCTKEYVPVCGQNSEGAYATFGNACLARAAGARIIRNGQC